MATSYFDQSIEGSSHTGVVASAPSARSAAKRGGKSSSSASAACALTRAIFANVVSAWCGDASVERRIDESGEAAQHRDACAVLVVGRHDRPRRMLRIRAREHVAQRFLVGRPVLAIDPVLRIDLETFQWVAIARLEAPQLLL